MVLNSVTSTLQWIRQPKPRDVLREQERMSVYVHTYYLCRGCDFVLQTSMHTLHLLGTPLHIMTESVAHVPADLLPYCRRGLPPSTHLYMCPCACAHVHMRTLMCVYTSACESWRLRDLRKPTAKSKFRVKEAHSGNWLGFGD